MTRSILICNKAHKFSGHVLGKGEYIGRPSPLGNPFAIGRNSTRDEVIEKYRNWLENRLTGAVFRDTAAVREFNRLCDKYVADGRLTLVCWCSPLPCHGDVIADFIEERVCPQ